MGCQGEIYNVLGIKLSEDQFEWHEKEEGDVFEVNGVSIGRITSDVDIWEGMKSCYNVPDLSQDLELSVSITDGQYCREFFDAYGDPSVLIGIVLAHEIYSFKESELPPIEDIEKCKPRVCELINNTFKLGLRPEELKIYLYWESVNGL